MLSKEQIGKLIELGEKGYVTYGEINELLGEGFVDSEVYEEIMDFLQERGVRIVESDEFTEDKEDEFTVSTGNLFLSTSDGDPVKLYLR